MWVGMDGVGVLIALVEEGSSQVITIDFLVYAVAVTRRFYGLSVLISFISLLLYLMPKIFLSSVNLTGFSASQRRGCTAHLLTSLWNSSGP